MQSQPDNVLTVVNVSSNSATACVRVFAAVLALAKNFKGYAAFARLLYDASPEAEEVARELRVKEVIYSICPILSCISRIAVNHWE